MSGARGAPEGPYIDSQRDNKAFGFGDGKIFLSEDNAKTWAHSAEFPYADAITFSVIDDRHYHVPLLLSPFAFSTYRGS